MLIDFIIIFVFVFTVFWGYKKGFSQMLISLVVFALSIFLVWGMFSFIGNAFFESDYGRKIVSDTAKGIETEISDITELGNDFQFLRSILDNSDVSATSKVLAKQSLKAVIALPLLIISFILLRLLLFFIRHVVSKTTKLPVIRGFDSLFGAMLGVIAGISVIAVLYFSMGYTQILPSMTFIKKQLDASYIMILINSIL